jgi:hypothetical protein
VILQIKSKAMHRKIQVQYILWMQEPVNVLHEFFSIYMAKKYSYEGLSISDKILYNRAKDRLGILLKFQEDLICAN